MRITIGRKMQAVADYVRENPGCTKIDAGMAAWDSWKSANMGYIYGPVNRAISAGLIRAEWAKNKYRLTIIK